MTHGAPAPYTVEYESFKEFKFGTSYLTLPALKINENTVIYALNIMGGNPRAITSYAVDLLTGYREKIDISADGFITAEGKSIPLVYEIACIKNLPYTVLRKSCKPYMGEKVLSSKIKTITTNEQQELYLDNKDLINITNKKLIFVDDVISSGTTLKACEKLVKLAGGAIIACMAMAIEGDYMESIPTYALTRLPIIKLINKKGGEK